MLYDGWLLRFTQGYSLNNNCVWPLYEGQIPLLDKLVFCQAQYAARGSMCGFRLAQLPEHKAIDALLTEHGYSRSNPNLVLTRDSVVAPDVDVVTELAVDEWLETIYRVRPGDANIKAWQRQVYARTTLPSRFAVVQRRDEVCGYGRSVQQGDTLNLLDLWVLPQYRGQGLGTQLIHGLLQLGRNDGSLTACLTVNEDNEGAQRLYERLGFVYRYLYWYMRPAETVD